MYEAQLAQLQQQTFNMESAALATENLRNTMATVDAMKVANKELRKQYGKIDIDKIEVLSPVANSMHNQLTLSRPSIMTWRIFSNKLTKSKSLWEGHMLFQMN